MTEKKMVSRNVAVGLGIVCIILAALVAGLVPALVNYASVIHNSNKDSEIAFLNFQITNLYGQIKQYLTYLNGNKTLLSQTQTLLNNNVTNYNAQITNLQNIISLEDTILLCNESVIEPESLRHIVYHNFNLLGSLEAPPIFIEYAGYVVVSIVSSTSNSTTVQLDYSSNQVSYNSTVTTGSSGSAYFPILPTKTLDINLLNTDSMNLNITRVTITYYY